MIKLVCLIQRPAHQSKEAFKAWWLGHHAQIAARLPGLRRYVISTSLLDENGQEAPYDGVAELWFEDRSAMEEAFASPAGRECAREDAELIGSRIAFLTEEHAVIAG